MHILHSDITVKLSNKLKHAQEPENEATEPACVNYIITISRMNMSSKIQSVTSLPPSTASVLHSTTSRATTGRDLAH